jgi:hypothetical protein
LNFSAFSEYFNLPAHQPPQQVAGGSEFPMEGVVLTFTEGVFW